jgi:CO/xanthine dehydrogenase FAD-binding subunit
MERPGGRRVPLRQFVTGNRRTVRAADELVTGILVPAPLEGAAVKSSFRKLGSRAYLVISIAMVAAILETDLEARILRARVAVGACSEVAQRLTAFEAELAGRTLDATIPAAVQAGHRAPLAPISDVRGTAAYRRSAALVLVRRALQDLVP